MDALTWIAVAIAIAGAVVAGLVILALGVFAWTDHQDEERDHWG